MRINDWQFLNCHSWLVFLPKRKEEMFYVCFDIVLGPLFYALKEKVTSSLGQLIAL